MKREGRDPILKKSSWLLLKRSENLNDWHGPPILSQLLYAFNTPTPTASRQHTTERNPCPETTR